MFIVRKKVSSLLAIASLSATSICHATAWPVFLPPDESFLAHHGYLDTAHCPKGEGKIHPDAHIPVQLHCKTFCPDEWQWIAKTDGQCHPLNNAFIFKNYLIQYQRDEEGVLQHTTVTAQYGQQDTNAVSFELTFKTPDQYWYCYEANNELHSVICGNDS